MMMLTMDKASFDEVMLLGDLFGHTGTAKSDVQLLVEVGRVLTPGGRLHLRFSDGDWTRRNYRPDGVEGLPTGFIYRHRQLSSDGHNLRTEIVSSSDEFGIACQQTLSEVLYSQREVTELLHRLGFDGITYDNYLEGSRLPAWSRAGAPQFIVHCRVARSGSVLRLVP